MHQMLLKALLNKTLKITSELQFGKVLNPGLLAGVWERLRAMRVVAPHHGALHLWLQPVPALGQPVTVHSVWYRVLFGMGRQRDSG